MKMAQILTNKEHTPEDHPPHHPHYHQYLRIRTHNPYHLYHYLCFPVLIKNQSMPIIIGLSTIRWFFLSLLPQAS